jgi:hypothetical protein
MYSSCLNPLYLRVSIIKSPNVILQKKSPYFLNLQCMNALKEKKIGFFLSFPLIKKLNTIQLFMFLCANGTNVCL